MEEYESARFHPFQRETENDIKRYHSMKDGGTYHDEDMLERGSPLDQSDQRGNRKRTRNWTYDQIMTLIKFWKKEDVLYNVKHPSYHDKDTKNNAINHIVAKLADEAVFVTCEEVVNKMHSLRVYFANKRNKLHDAKKAADSGQDDNFKITWPYYESLMFLNENVISRSSSSASANKQSGCDVDVDEHERYCDADGIAPPHKSAKKIDRGMIRTERMFDVDDTIPTSSGVSLTTMAYQPYFSTQGTSGDGGRSDDDIFCEMIGRQLKKIPEGATKDFFKLDLYRFVVSNTYRSTNNAECNKYGHNK